MPSKKGKKRGTRSSAKKPTRGHQAHPGSPHSSELPSMPAVFNRALYHTSHERSELRDNDGTQVGGGRAYSMTEESLDDPSPAFNTKTDLDVPMSGTSEVFAAASTDESAVNNAEGSPPQPDLDTAKSKRKAKVWPPRRRTTRRSPNPMFNGLPLELQIKILHFAVPKRTIWIRQKDGKWQASCHHGPPIALQVSKKLRKIMIAVQYYDVQAPKDIRMETLEVENLRVTEEVYFDPSKDDIIFDLDDIPGADKLLHWVKDSCFPKLERIAVLRGVGQNWEKDFYFEELALGLKHFGNVKSLILSQRFTIWAPKGGILIEGNSPKGTTVKKDGTHLLGTTKVMGRDMQVSKWMDVKSHAEIPELSEKELPIARNSQNGERIEYTINEWRPSYHSQGWGRDSERYHGLDLMDMWFARMESENPGWEAPRVTLGILHRERPIVDLGSFPDNRIENMLQDEESNGESDGESNEYSDYL